MENNVHKVAGVFATIDDLYMARNLLINRGIPDGNISLIIPDDHNIDKKIEPHGDEVAKTVVKDALLGSAIGGGVGAAGAAAMRCGSA